MNDVPFHHIPFSKIIKFGQQTMLQRPLFSVSWILGRFCNYKCSYCWPYANSQTPDHQEFDVYTRAIDSIKHQARTRGFTEFHFSFSGGEPTAYKKFKQLVAYYTNDPAAEYQSIHMTTNLSPSIQWWESWCKLTATLTRRSITASFHAEFADEQEFADKCKFLIERGVFVTVNQVMVPALFEQYLSRCQRFYDQGINVTLKPQSDPTASFIVDGYTQAQLDWLQQGFPQQWSGQQLSQVELVNDHGDKYYVDQAERFNAFGFNKFQGWQCNSGYQSVIIRGNEVKRSYSCHDAPLGTLSEGFKLFDSPAMCITPSCVSSADSKIPKKKV